MNQQTIYFSRHNIEFHISKPKRKDMLGQIDFLFLYSLWKVTMQRSVRILNTDLAYGYKKIGIHLVTQTVLVM